jgi:HK97 family phage major capsid protein
METTEILQTLSKEITELGDRIANSESETATKSDLTKIAERLEAFEKVSQGGKAKQRTKFWDTDAQASEFVDYLIDGPLDGHINKAQKSRLQGSSLTKADYANITTDGEGGHLVPELFSNTLQERFNSYGAARQLHDVYQIDGGSLELAFNDGGTTALFKSEGTNADYTKEAFDTVVLNPKIIIALTAASQSLLNQSRFSIADIVGRALVRANGYREDFAVFRGTGASNDTSGGITGYENASIGEVELGAVGDLFKVNASGTPDDANPKGVDALIQAMNTVDSYAIDGDTAWYMNRRTLNSLHSVKDTTGQPVIRMGFNESPFGSLFGYPIRPIEILGPNSEAAIDQASEVDTLVLFGSLRRAGAIGVSGSVSIAFDDHYDFRAGLSAWRLFSEFDFKVTDPNAVARIVNP